MSVAVCVDIGSTFTKAMLVGTDRGELLATAAHPTTVGTDVLDGVDACRSALAAQDRQARDAEVLACSSAGGGLRIAVVGNEELVTAEAGRRVALNSGGKVVAVLAAAASEDPADLGGSLRGAAPDVVLLTGGTDGGNAEMLLAGARAVARSGWQGPVVVAGNVHARDAVGEILGDRPHVVADNVVPRIGELAPDSARAAIREMFLRHVIGGKGLSSRPEFVAMVRGATPDLVLAGVELLAGDRDRTAGDGVVVVDVGGATTDVHSVVDLDPETAELGREVVASVTASRTVEADLGMRWSAETTADAGVQEGLLEETPDLRNAAARRVADPGYLPAGDDEVAHDELLAGAAVGVALRRHAGRARVVLGPDGRVVERTGKDLREVSLLVGSGGVLRTDPATGARVLAGVVGEAPGGWQLPRSARTVVDRDHVLAAAGLLATDHPDAARGLVRRLLGAETVGGIA